jgi:tetratricopeptide (TPR) repeat protein
MIERVASRPSCAALVSTLVTLLSLTPHLAMAQTSPHQERSPIGSLINQDYYTANLYPEVSRELNLVNNNHVNERVWNSYFAGNYEGALADCKFALTYFPNHPQPLNLLCELAKALDQPALPIKYFEHALQLYPQHAFTHAQYGRYLIDSGVRAAGIEELKEALRLEPNSPQIQAWLNEAQPPATAARPDSSGSKSTGSGESRKD